MRDKNKEKRNDTYSMSGFFPTLSQHFSYFFRHCLVKQEGVGFLEQWEPNENGLRPHIGGQALFLIFFCQVGRTVLRLRLVNKSKQKESPNAKINSR